MSTSGTALKRRRKVDAGSGRSFEIAEPVGEWSKGAVNRPNDVETVQILLEHAASTSKRPALDPRGIDGLISCKTGRSSTVKAIHAFQRGFMSRSDGLVEPGRETMRRLKAAADLAEDGSPKGASRAKMNESKPGEGLPAWLNLLAAAGGAIEEATNKPVEPGSKSPKWIGVAENELGTKEIEGKSHNERVVAYHRSTDQHKNKKVLTDEKPWCSSFVGWVLEQAGYESSESAWSHSYKRWGDGIAKPAVGAVAFIDWGLVYPDDDKKQDRGHVGFVVGRTKGGRIVLLGGNQDNRVKYGSYRKANIHAYRVPKGYTPPDDAYELPVLAIAAGGGGFSETR